MAIPSIPTNFYLQQANAQAYLSWDLVAGASSYQVQRSTDGVTYAIIDSPTVNNFLDDTVVAGTQYFYKVASTNGDGTSSYTSAQSCVPERSGIISLGQIRLMAQQRAEMVNSKFVTVPEWNTYINQSYFELYDLLTNVYEDYYLAPALEFSTDGSSSQYDLPDGENYDGAPAFYKLVGVDCGLSNGDNAFISLNKFNFIDRNKFVFPNISSTYYGVFNLQYRVMGDKLMFIPIPAGQQLIRMWYQPRLVELLQDTDPMDGISGWTEYVITDAAIKALQKEESDVSVLAAQKMALIKRIEESAINRDIGEPSSISDVRANGRFGRGWGPNGNGSSGGF